MCTGEESDIVSFKITLFQSLKNYPFTISRNSEGYKYHSKYNRMVFGCRAGPDTSIENLMHEIAHFIEIDYPRALSPGWGFTLPEEYVIDRFCYILSTDRHIMIYCIYMDSTLN